MYARLHHLLREAMGEGVRSRVLAAPGSMVEIVPTVLGIDAPLLGAAELALSAVIEDPSRVVTRAHRGG
jgi:hypothetical protein